MNAFPMLRSALRTRAPTAFPRMYYSTNPSAPTPTASSTAPSSSSPSSTAPSTPSPPPTRSSTLDEIQAGLRAQAANTNTKSSSPSFSTSKRSAAESDKFKWESHFNVSSSSSARSMPPPSAPTPQDNWRTSQIVGYTAPITTTSARSFAVLGGDVGRAFRRLNRVLRDNNVRRELKRQERFESGSDKRVRLDSERHRRRFKVAVGKAVSLAMRMKDM